MGKEKQYVKIGDKDFLLVKGYGKPIGSYNDIFDAYDRPSIYKIGIWNSWKKWFIENYEYYTDFIEISSRNCMIFTICGVITSKDVTYGFYITKTRNEVWIL